MIPDNLPAVAGPQLVVAVGDNGEIGAAGRLPWHAPEDLAHFKAVTLGHTLIMGSVTWASIGRPLPGRRTIVVSRRGLTVPPEVTVADEPGKALDLALRSDVSPCVVGGAQIFAALAPRCVRLWRTDVAVSVPDADAFWPEEVAGFVEVASWQGDDPRLTFRVFDRMG